MADRVIANQAVETPRLDTVSYYDDSEPNWNERPYFAKVEEQRGRSGCHIDVESQQSFILASTETRPTATPYYSSVNELNQVRQQMTNLMTARGYRVLLSGLGGDEVLGGVPTPIPELMDLLASARITTLAHQLKAWALFKRRPWVHLLVEALRGFLPFPLVGLPSFLRPAPWLNREFARRHSRTLAGYPSRIALAGPAPSFQESLSTLEALRRQLQCIALTSDPPYEIRYPYLDRELLEYLYAIPREQLARPGQRRSLMRRALTGIVPDEVLNRRRKAFVVRSPLRAISAEWDDLARTGQRMISSSIGIIDSGQVLKALESARQGKETRIVALMHTFSIEFWLQNLVNHGTAVGLPKTMNRGSLVQGLLRSLSHCICNRDQLANCARDTPKKGGEKDEIREARNHGIGLCPQSH